MDRETRSKLRQEQYEKRQQEKKNNPSVTVTTTTKAPAKNCNSCSRK